MIPSLRKCLSDRGFLIGVAIAALVTGSAYVFIFDELGIPLVLGVLAFYLLTVSEASRLGLVLRIIAAIGVCMLSFMWTGFAYLDGRLPPNLALRLSPIYLVTGLLTGLLLRRFWYLAIIPALVPVLHGDLVNVAAFGFGSGLGFLVVTWSRRSLRVGKSP